MSKCNIHEGDVGSLIYVDIVDCDGVAVPLDLASVALYLTKPISGDVVGPLGMSYSTELATDDRIAATGDGLDGRMVYATLAAQLDESGTWRGHPRITEGATVLWASEFTFVVRSTPIS